MNMTLNTPTNLDEKAQVEAGNAIIEALVGATISVFGATEDGGVLIEAWKGGERIQIVLAADGGELALYQVEAEEGEPV